MIYLILFLFIFLFFLIYLKQLGVVERFQNTIPITSMFRIKIGLWKEPGFAFNHRYLTLLSSSLPIEIVQFDNKYEPFYQLKKRNVDFVLSSEKDYMVYSINQKLPPPASYFKRTSSIQMITAAYHIHYLIVADYAKIVNYNQINDSNVQVSPKNHLGLDCEYELFSDYTVHFKNRDENIEKAYNDLTVNSSILLDLNVHPNKLLLEKSNEKELYLLDALKINSKSDYLTKFLFLNKSQIDLRYYPKILQRTTSNEIGYKLNTYSTRALLLGLDILSKTYVYQFMNVYFKMIDEIRNKYPYYNNFKDSEISHSRLTLEDRTLSIHEGAKNFYKRIGNITNNSDIGCALIANECTTTQLKQFGDYLLNI
jgi:hypothetical protein